MYRVNNVTDIENVSLILQCKNLSPNILQYEISPVLDMAEIQE